MTIPVEIGSAVQIRPKPGMKRDNNSIHWLSPAPGLVNKDNTHREGDSW